MRPTPGADSRRVAIAFSEPNAVFFEAAGCRRITLRDVDEIEAEILRRYEGGSWDINHAIVTEGITAETLSVIVASIASASIELELTGARPQSLTLASPEGNTRVVRSVGIGFTVVGAAGAMPLFRSASLRRRILRCFALRDQNELVQRSAKTQSLQRYSRTCSGDSDTAKSVTRYCAISFSRDKDINCNERVRFKKSFWRGS
jgi:hypothetical protein